MRDRLQPLALALNTERPPCLGLRALSLELGTPGQHQTSPLDIFRARADNYH